ncbi:MAG TPA: isoprenylcysteine carboxylmethyltransferase family protein [Bryobacteraceae bacterium]|nr:isoprenylcysteine carboxylmethyltransferase family protein [Bryobacteraceae bacterium]
MYPEIYYCTRAAWVVVGFVWLLAAVVSKRTARSEPVGSRLAHLAIMIAAFALLFSSTLALGPLGERFVPDRPAIAWTGFVLCVTGCAISIWARLMLGGNWSATVTVKQHHTLIRRGPYAVVRHPIYSGFLLAALGTSLVVGEWRGLLGLALAVVGWRTKSRVEEAFMREQFGAAYIDYQRDVKALIPFVL